MTCGCLCGCRAPLARTWRVLPMRDMRWGPVVNPYVVTVSVCERCVAEIEALEGSGFAEVMS